MDFSTGPDDIGRRFDRVCRILLPGQSLGAIYSAIRKGKILVCGKKKEGAYRIARGDIIFISDDMVPRPGKPENHRLPVTPKTEPPILLENDHFIVFNKPAGILTHGKDSVKSYLEYLQKSRPRDSVSFSPAPLHRLDRNTSGVLVCSNSLQGAAGFSRLLREKKLRKVYLALNAGEIRGPGTWKDRILRDGTRKVSSSSQDGEEAELVYIPLLSSAGATLTIHILITGLTHQIRVQSGIHGHPLIGDKKYGGPVRPGPERGYLLHACLLGPSEDVKLPGFRQVFAPLPPYFTAEIAHRFPPRDVHKLLSDLPDLIKEKISSISSF